MKKTFISICALMLMTSIAINAKVLRNYSSQSDGKLTFTVDSIDYRSDLTRIYGKLRGRAHTSNRVDGVIYMGKTSSYTSTDIEGVDFRRYFQWEDDECIPIELDFPKMEIESGAQLIFNTPYGQSTTMVKVAKPGKHK